MSMSRWAGLCLVALLAAGPANSLPLPPPPADRLAIQQQFFQALPKRLPVEDLSGFAPFVAEDLTVYRAGEPMFSNREQWFEFLQSFGGKTASSPQGMTISREEFYATQDGDIVVVEFLWPIPPKGKEGQISYHQSYDFQLVSYRLEQGVLVRVDYSKPLRRYDQWLKEQNSDVPRSR